MKQYEPYKRRFTEDTENSLDSIKNKDHISKFVEFIRQNPFPTDDAVHEWSKSQAVDNGVTENIAYALLSVILAGGKSHGQPLYNVSNGELKKGIGVEMEHVECKYDDNEMVSYMQEVYATKIATDHLNEFDTYYAALDKMETELKK